MQGKVSGIKAFPRVSRMRFYRKPDPGTQVSLGAPSTSQGPLSWRPIPSKRSEKTPGSGTPAIGSTHPPLDADALAGEALRVDHDVRFVQHEHGDLLDVDGSPFETPVQHGPRRPDDDLLLQRAALRDCQRRGGGGMEMAAQRRPTRHLSARSSACVPRLSQIPAFEGLVASRLKIADASLQPRGGGGWKAAPGWEEREDGGSLRL